MSTHDEVAHAWAHQTGRQQRGPNMFYNGPCVFSYGRHFTIARLVIVPSRAEPIVMITSRSRSVSTARHKYIVSRAVSHLDTFFVDAVMADSPQEHVANYNQLLVEAHDLVVKAARARLCGEMRLRDAQNCVARANDYAALFLPRTARLQFSDLDTAIAGIAKRVAAARKKAEQAQRKKRRAETLASRERLLQWLAGANVQPPRTPRVYVRVNGNVVQTSWGASVPLADAIRVWHALKHARSTGATFAPDAGRVGDFAVREISPRGIRAGCHVIPYCAAKMAAEFADIE